MTHHRREFPASVRKAAWARCDGRCEDCGREITGRPGDRPEYDHDIPDALGGKPDLENCRVRCKACHGAKTRTEDMPRIAKAKRLEAERFGLRAAKRRLPGGKDSAWKMKVGGSWVRREE